MSKSDKLRNYYEKPHFSQPCAADLVQPNLVHTNLVRGNRPAHKVAQGTGELADGHIISI